MGGKIYYDYYSYIYKFKIYILLMESEMSLVLKKLDTIKVELDFIKNNMVDIDSILTEEDYQSLIEYRKEKSTGKLISHDHLKKELGL